MPYVIDLVHYLAISVLIFVLYSDVGKCSVEKGADQKEQSSNQISLKQEEKAKVEEQVYYLPLQTVFSETHTSTNAGSVSATSPPHISIEPAPIQTHYQESTSVLYEAVSAEEYNAASQCVSETPVIELESRFLFPSKDAVKESVVMMAGHLEVASKTNSVEEALEKVPKPSVALQGTEFHYHTVSDL